VDAVVTNGGYGGTQPPGADSHDRLGRVLGAALADLFAAEVGAGASLTGLLFVAVSINLERILSFPKLPARASETLTLLLLVVVVASLGLAPPGAGVLAAEITACAGAPAAVVLAVQLRHGGGLYWMLPATLTAFIGAVSTAWILLVEIIRHNRP
jgi:hypothetical protein